MKKICFCFQIHIPIATKSYRFLDIGQDHQYFDDGMVHERVHKVNVECLIPLLDMIKDLHIEMHRSFNVGISVSGTSLILLQKYAPDTINKLLELTQRNCIEFLSEPWSHSIVPFTNKDLLLKQINRHDKLIHTLFGKTPSVFIAHSPHGSYNIIEPIISKQKMMIFAYTNHVLDKSTQRSQLTSRPHSPKGVLFTNTKISQVFQKINFNPNKHVLQEYVSRIQSRFNKNNPHLYPLIVAYNPIQLKNILDIGQVVLWKTIFKRIYHFYGFKFYLPGEIKNEMPDKYYETLLSDKVAESYHLPNLWLSDKIQRDAFRKQLRIQDLIKNVKDTSLNSNWDFLQDMDNLFFMSDHFLQPSFAATYFNPYSSPYMAYINYMNILDDLQDRLKNRTPYTIFHAGIRRKKKIEISN